MSRWALAIVVPVLLLVGAGVSSNAEAGVGPVPSFKLRALDMAQGLQPLLQPQLWAAAQTDEPTAPGGAAGAAKPKDEPGAGGEPGAARPDEPGGAAPAAPAASASPAGEPAGVVTKKVKEVSYGLGFQFRGVFVPFLGLFLDSYTDLASVSLGAEFVRRKGNFDIVASVNFGFYSPPDGNYLGNGKSPAVDTDYIQFRDLNVLAFDVAFIWHHDFTPWLSLVYGAGLGLGIVLGDIYRISNYQGNCTHENVGDPGQCNPINPTTDPTGASLKKWNENHDAWLADNCHTTGGDSPLGPCQYREEDVWPVVPIVHLLIGVNFKINEQFSIRVDGGFHDAFYVGAASHYFF